MICVIRDLTADSNICTLSGSSSVVILSGGGKGLSREKEIKTAWRERVIERGRWVRLLV